KFFFQRSYIPNASTRRQKFAIRVESHRHAGILNGGCFLKTSDIPKLDRSIRARSNRAPSIPREGDTTHLTVVSAVSHRFSPLAHDPHFHRAVGAAREQ